MSSGQNNKKNNDQLKNKPTDQPTNVYSYDKKKRLAKKISTLKRKKDMVKILEIISEDNTNITENQNGLFMFFHKLNDATYHKIDLYLSINQVMIIRKSIICLLFYFSKTFFQACILQFDGKGNIPNTLHDLRL